MTHRISDLFGLTWNPFSADVPVEALWKNARLEDFCWRMEELVRGGGFALITGPPGTGKSVALRLLAHHLQSLPDVTAGALTRPQSAMADFYRELGTLFGLDLRPHNRWAGFKTLRDLWLGHVEATRVRPVLLVDEAQEMPPATLAELRLADLEFKQERYTEALSGFRTWLRYHTSHAEAIHGRMVTPNYRRPS